MDGCEGLLAFHFDKRAKVRSQCEDLHEECIYLCKYLSTTNKKAAGTKEGLF